MKVGLHISDFTWQSGAAGLRSKLAEIAQQAEQADVDRISVMDHVWQTAPIRPERDPMLEAYTTLGWMAAKTERVRLLTLVTAAVYREPGLLAKAVSTLDVLSGGRAMLGIGAAWYAAESRGLGLFFPPVAERFERLEETLQIVKQMWCDSESPYDGRHYHLARTLNSPQPLHRPHPPILVGGSGEKKTLRLVARYADACNINVSEPRAAVGKLAVLREHCERENRNYDEIEKTVHVRYALGANGENVSATVERLHALAEAGFTVAHGPLRNIAEPAQFELFVERIIPAVEKF